METVLIERSLEERCRDIEVAIPEVAVKSREAIKETQRLVRSNEEHLRNLREKRKVLRKFGADTEVAKISKMIQKELRKSSRERCRAQIGHLLSQFRDLKQITNIRSNGKRQHITSMTNSAGEIVDDKKRDGGCVLGFF
jgi:hypothetical protein